MTISLLKNEKKSFYFRGTSGSFAWLFNKYLRANKKRFELVNAILEAKDLDEQQKIYNELEPKIITRFIKWMMNRHVTMSLLGVPRPQRQLIIDQYPGGISAYLTDNLRHIFTELPIQSNYFWRLYIKGNYTKRCCPNYLRQEYFDFYKSHQNKIATHTTSISQFLKDKPGQYSHFILLDHQDWLAAHDVKALEEEWTLILKNSFAGTKILLRSASLNVDFFPEFLEGKVVFLDEKAKEFHTKDRVGTYGSTYLLEVL